MSKVCYCVEEFTVLLLGAKNELRFDRNGRIVFCMSRNMRDDYIIVVVLIMINGGASQTDRRDVEGNNYKRVSFTPCKERLLMFNYYN